MKKLARFFWPMLLAVIGLAFIVGAGVLFINSFRDTGTTFLGPGTTSVTIAKPGEYTLWHESKTLINGQFISLPDDLPSGTTINVFKQPAGTPVMLHKNGSSSMEINGMRRVSIGDLSFSSPGAYKIVVTGLVEKHAFYLDEATFMRTLFTVLIYTFAGILFLFSGIGFGIYVYVQSSKRER